MKSHRWAPHFNDDNSTSSTLHRIHIYIHVCEGRSGKTFIRQSYVLRPSSSAYLLTAPGTEKLSRKYCETEHVEHSTAPLADRANPFGFNASSALLYGCSQSTIRKAEELRYKLNKLNVKLRWHPRAWTTSWGRAIGDGSAESLPIPSPFPLRFEGWVPLR